MDGPVAASDETGGSIRPMKDWPSTSSSKYRRKERSLAILTTRFLAKCVQESVQIIDLTVFSKEMGIPRRRLYDIVNILENIGSTTRKEKASYVYNGAKNVSQTLRRIQEQSATISASLTATLMADCNGPERKTYSLGRLCMCFLAFLFWSDTHMSTLEEFARALFPIRNDSEQMTAYKNCIRRLYDVVNVLVALGVVEKVSGISKKHSYRLNYDDSDEDDTPQQQPPPSQNPSDNFSTPMRPPVSLHLQTPDLPPSLTRPGNELLSKKSAFQSYPDGIPSLSFQQGPPASILLVKDTPSTRSHLDRILSLDAATLSANPQSALVDHYRAVLDTWLDRTARDRFHPY